MRYAFRLPDVGEGIHEAEIVSYDVQPGDTVRQDQIIVKVETDKAVVTLPAPADGTILEIPHQAGDVLSVGAPVIFLEVEASSAPQKLTSTEKETPPVSTPEKSVPAAVAPPPNGKRILATPHTRYLARQLGVAIQHISGTGKGGRITDEDVNLAAREKPPEAPLIPRAAAVSHEASTLGFEFEKYGPTRRVPLKGIRKRIAEVMVRSFSTIPHVNHTDEADVTELLAVLKKQRPVAESRGVKLTLTAFIAKAVISALKTFPDVNTSLDEETGDIVYKDYYHLGIATDTEQGLMVPVVHQADQKSILEIAAAIQQLAERARNREIELDELRGGTFSITNVGAIGGIHASPIILHPQVAILGVMAARKKPVVVDDEIVIRTMMPLVVAFDHRLLDGAMMARFLRHIIGLLEDPLRMLVELA
jgi:pyruvate dehydrogenase E2 component (dihydrolipoamide acetyltransferase)